jgi:hypothetical protein
MTSADKGSIGDTLEAFLEEDGIRDEVYAVAAKRVIAWQLEQARKARHIKKTTLAKAMGTSRTQVDRVLDPSNTAVSLDLLSRTATAVGKRLNLELVDA